MDGSAQINLVLLLSCDTETLQLLSLPLQESISNFHLLFILLHCGGGADILYVEAVA